LGLPTEALPALLQDPSLAQYEKGLLSTDAFLAAWQERFPHLSTPELIDAWNAMLLGPLPGVESLLDTLASRFSLALLSNTNDLHLSIVEPDILPWSPYFVDMFFSNRLRRRKPDPETYLEVLRRLGWKPEETLFVDDSPANLQGATAAGLHTHLLDPPNQPKQLLALDLSLIP
jgi:putative hydrolase of the HAD superfamily